MFLQNLPRGSFRAEAARSLLVSSCTMAVYSCLNPPMAPLTMFLNAGVFLAGELPHQLLGKKRWCTRTIVHIASLAAATLGSLEIGKRFPMARKLSLALGATQIAVSFLLPIIYSPRRKLTVKWTNFQINQYSELIRKILWSDYQFAGSERQRAEFCRYCSENLLQFVNDAANSVRKQETQINFFQHLPREKVLLFALYCKIADVTPKIFRLEAATLNELTKKLVESGMDLDTEYKEALQSFDNFEYDEIFRNEDYRKALRSIDIFKINLTDMSAKLKRSFQNQIHNKRTKLFISYNAIHALVLFCKLSANTSLREKVSLHKMACINTVYRKRLGYSLLYPPQKNETF